MDIKILNETDTLVFGQEPDDLRALSIMTLVSTLAPEYGTEPMFSFVERMKDAIDAKTYGIVYERKEKGSPVLVPVGYVTWALLSRAASVVFEKRLRPLRPTEMKSGSRLWVIDLCAPLGHGPDMVTRFEELFPDHETYDCTRRRDGRMHKETKRNKTRINKQREAEKGGA